MTIRYKDDFGVRMLNVCEDMGHLWEFMRRL